MKRITTPILNPFQRKGLVSIILTALFLLPFGKAGMGYGQTWVTIPDANFVTYLQSIIPAAMSGNQMNTSSTLVTTRDTINVNGYGLSISNLSGIQYFTSLKYLDCGVNSLTSLPALPNTLTFLACEINSLTSLPALPNSITSIDCYNNQLTSLPALPASLTYLDCFGNQLTSLPALPNSLTTLVCNTNSLTTLSALPNSLHSLECHNNNITCFPTFPNSITNMYIYSNPYNCLPNHIAAMNSTDLAVPLCAAGNSNGCPVATGIQQVAGNNEQVTVYPNPAKEIINVKLEIMNETATLQITDILGNTLKQFIIHNSSLTISVSDLAEGVYQLIIHNSQLIITKRVVIVR
ncbi:MAG: leucine-rich repeat domain-containing protein [Bacteroidia bacterium]